MAWSSRTSIILQFLVFFFLNAVHAKVDDMDTIYNRTIRLILSTPVSSDNITKYINSLNPDGSWKDVSYKSGCKAQRSSWPAADHWLRLLEMTVAYHRDLPLSKNQTDVRSAIQKAMEYWFSHDYKDSTCMDREFIQSHRRCSCKTPGLWGPNWYSNVIQVPTRVGKVCVLLRPELTDNELQACTLMTSRAYAPFYRHSKPGYLRGANVMDIAVIEVLGGLLENHREGNVTRIGDAYNRVHGQVLVRPKVRSDGIKPDGSFQQHSGIIYDGNYGKDFSNDFMQLELLALHTQFQANKSIQESFAKYFDGAKWMAYTNLMTRVVHWDLTVIGRFISYPVVDGRASANLQMNLSAIVELGNAWSQHDLIQFGATLTGISDISANSGGLLGTRMFWNSDYLVHRTPETVSTLKMISTRTTTPECVNSENPFGFHLSDGLVYTYSTGAEYEDIFAALDYDIPPGITTDYAVTKLGCGATHPGVNTYAGGVEADDVGMAAIQYLKPKDQSFGFYKAWFFFPNNVQHVLVPSIQQARPNAPVFSVLDQRLRSGDVYLDGQMISKSDNFSEVNRLWHGGTGYAFPLDQSTRVSVRLQNRTGDWSKISTSKVPPSAKDMFAAWLVHSRSDAGANHRYNFHTNDFPPLEYSVFPATKSYSEFEKKAKGFQPRTVVSSKVVSAAMDSRAEILGAAFWQPSGGSISVKEMGIKVEVDRGVIFMLKFKDPARIEGSIYVADPSHDSESVTVNITRPNSAMPGRHAGDWCSGYDCSTAQGVMKLEEEGDHLELKLPQGGMAGSTVVKPFSIH
ncbi:unnamed protein product [Rhizoctonia solani]|uniref:Chondroitin AC lyase n=1 Tax=Rhizoctonia solani TaxID=456999 RepID=A0A8H2WKS1_9AGAM|nr:unnamed protein product [Rhizoctonia solani]